MKLSTPEKDEPSSPLKILIMGAPGSHKTTLGLQFPHVHVIDCDRGLDGPKLFLRKGYQDPSTKTNIAPPLPSLTMSYAPIRYDERGNMREVYECYDEVIAECTRIARERAKDYSSTKTVFLDSLSHVNEFIIRKVMKLKGSEMNFETRWWTEFKSLAYKLLVSKLEETGLTVLCSAHEIKLVEPDKDKITQQRVLGYEPFFQGKVGDTIGAFFTDVWRMEIRPVAAGRVQTVLLTTRTNTCDYLKNSLGMPGELVLDEGNNFHGFKAIEPYLKGRI